MLQCFIPIRHAEAGEAYSKCKSAFPNHYLPCAGLLAIPCSEIDKFAEYGARMLWL
jgi:hypothetical protein